MSDQFLSFGHLYGLTASLGALSFMISTNKVRRNTEKLRQQVRQVLSLLEEMEQYRPRKTSKS